MRPLLAQFLTLSFCTFAYCAQASERVALVMGNSHYQKLPVLENCAQDARLMADTFGKLDIRVAGGKPLTDLTADQMDKAINDFAGALGPDTEAFVYFSGHGVQVDGLNYLLPVDFRAEYQSQVKRQAIALDDVLALLEGSRAKLRVIILDSCRDPGQFLTGEPATKGLGRAKGLAEQKVDAPETLVCFATKHGTPAFSANDAAYSFYTGILAEEMLKPGRIEDVLRAVARRVYEKTEKQQLPFTYGSLLNDHYFMPGAAQPVIAMVPTPTVPVTPVPMPVIPPAVLMQAGEGSVRIESTPPGCRFTLSAPDPQLNVLKKELSEKENRFAVKGLSKGENATLRSRISDLKFQIQNYKSSTPSRSGTTPMEVTGLTVGTWKLVISRENWPDYEKEVSINRGPNPALSHEFRGGAVKITSEPSGASVTLNGKEMGTTPLTLDNLPPGSRSFRLSREGYATKTLEVRVEMGETVALSGELQRQGNFDGTWRGTVFGKFSNGASESAVNTYAISGNAVQLTFGDGAALHFNGERSGSEMSFSGQQPRAANAGADVSSWISDWTLTLSNDGNALSVFRSTRFKLGPIAGVSGTETGTLHRVK